MRPILPFTPKTCSKIIKLKNASFSLRRKLSSHKWSNVSGSQTPDLFWQSCGSRLESDGGINHVWSQAHFCSLWGWVCLLYSSPVQSSSGQHRKCRERSRPQQNFLSQLHTEHQSAQKYFTWHTTSWAEPTTYYSIIRRIKSGYTRTVTYIVIFNIQNGTNFATWRILAKVDVIFDENENTWT